MVGGWTSGEGAGQGESAGLKSDDHMARTDVSEMKTECLLRFQS